jgi:hypothetical protein
MFLTHDIKYLDPALFTQNTIRVKCAETMSGLSNSKPEISNIGAVAVTRGKMYSKKWACFLVVPEIKLLYGAPRGFKY